MLKDIHAIGPGFSRQIIKEEEGGQPQPPPLTGAGV